MRRLEARYTGVAKLDSSPGRGHRSNRRKRLGLLFVRDIMTRKVNTVTPSATIAKAASSMVRSHIGSLVVLEGGKAVAMVTEGDISRAVARGLDTQKGTVDSIMSKRLITTSLDIRVEEAAKIMADNSIKKLPVLDKGKLAGIVTQTDIVASSFDLVSTLKEMVRARYRPPDFVP